MLQEVEPEGEFLWNNKVLVHLMLPGRRDVWATVVTKRARSLDLMLSGPKGCATLGQITSLARDRELDATREDRDVVRLSFRTLDDLRKGDLPGFLREHRAAALQAEQSR